MPTYDYKCPQCKLIMEISQKMSDNCEIYCPTCLINMHRGPGGGSALHFKGTGFYVNDYQ